MVTSASPPQSTTGSHIDVTLSEFERRLAARGHNPEEIHRLWQELAAEAPAPPATRTLGLGAVIAVYLGLLLVVVASVSVLTVYWHGLGAWGILALGGAFLTGSLVAAEILRRAHIAQAADVLEAVAVGWVGLVTYAVQRLVGVWPRGASHIDHVHSGLTVIAAAGLAAALVLLALRPDRLLIVPVALAAGLLAVDAAELVFGDEPGPRLRVVFLVPVGVAWIAGGLWLDVTGRRPYATWAHWVGLAAAAGAIVVLVPKTVPGFTAIGVLGASALFFSAFVRHWSFTVVGALGVLLAIMSALSLLEGMAPFLIALVGLALVVVGLRWRRWRERMRDAVLARMPDAARSFVLRLSA